MAEFTKMVFIPVEITSETQLSITGIDKGLLENNSFTLFYWH